MIYRDLSLNNKKDRAIHTDALRVEKPISRNQYRRGGNQAVLRRFMETVYAGC